MQIHKAGTRVKLEMMQSADTRQEKMTIQDARSNRDMVSVV